MPITNTHAKAEKLTVQQERAREAEDVSILLIDRTIPASYVLLTAPFLQVTLVSITAARTSDGDDMFSETERDFDSMVFLVFAFSFFNLFTLSLGFHPRDESWSWQPIWGTTTRCFFFFLIFQPCYVAYRILIPPPGTESAPPAMEAQSLNHWMARDVPKITFFIWFSLKQCASNLLLGPSRKQHTSSYNLLTRPSTVRHTNRLAIFEE